MTRVFRAGRGRAGLVHPEAGAAAINHVISFDTTGTPNPAILDITIDTDLIGVGDGLNAGLTVNSVNFLHDGNIVSANPFGVDTILIYDDTGDDGVAA